MASDRENREILYCLLVIFRFASIHYFFSVAPFFFRRHFDFSFHIRTRLFLSLLLSFRWPFILRHIGWLWFFRFESVESMRVQKSLFRSFRRFRAGNRYHVIYPYIFITHKHKLSFSHSSVSVCFFIAFCRSVRLCWYVRLFVIISSSSFLLGQFSQNIFCSTLTKFRKFLVSFVFLSLLGSVFVHSLSLFSSSTFCLRSVKSFANALRPRKENDYQKRQAAMTTMAILVSAF